MAARNTHPCWTLVPCGPGSLQLDMFAGPSVHPRLPRFMLSHPRAFVVNRNIVGVASILPGEAMNMQEFGAVSVYNHYPFTPSWKELINLSYHANKLGRWGMTPQGYPVSGGRSEQAGRGYSQTWLCDSSAVLPNLSNQPFSSPASIHFAASLLLVQMQLGDAE